MGEKKKSKHISGLVQFKPVLLKGQLYFLVLTFSWRIDENYFYILISSRLIPFSHWIMVYDHIIKRGFYLSCCHAFRVLFFILKVWLYSSRVCIRSDCNILLMVQSIELLKFFICFLIIDYYYIPKKIRLFHIYADFLINC